MQTKFPAGRVDQTSLRPGYPALYWTGPIVRETCGASRSFEVGLRPLFLRQLIKTAQQGEQLRSEEPPEPKPAMRPDRGQREPAAELRTEIEARLSELEPDVEVLAVETAGSWRSPTLRVFLDRPGGVDLELCARTTQHLRELLRDYRLEVSSPGPERPLTKVEHYRRFLGSRVRVRTREAIEGKNDFKGELIGADDRGVALAGDWGTVTIPHERIRRSNLIAQRGKTGRNQ
jgi:ribosome maturation factor RimP